MKEFLALPKQIQIRELLRFLSVTVSSAVLPFMSMYYVQYFGTLWTGILVIVTQVMGLLASLYGGHLSDSIGRKKVMEQGYFLASIGWLMAIFANIPGHILPLLTFAGALLVNVASNYMSPAFDAMIIDMTDETNRRFVYTLGYWLVNISVMIGAGIAGIFYDSHLFELLIALFVTNMLCYVIVYRRFDETKSEKHVFEHGNGILDSFKNYGQVLQDMPFMLYTLGIMLYGSIWAQVDNYLSVHLKIDFQPIHLLGQTITGAKMLSIIVLINTVMIIILMTTINSWTKSWKLGPQLIIGSIVFSLGMLVSFSVQSFWPIALAVAFYTLGEMIYVPASQVLRADMMDEGKVGSYSGLVAMANPLGHMIAGAMVSLSHFTGVLGVQISLVILAVSGIYLMLHSARLKGIHIF